MYGEFRLLDENALEREKDVIDGLSYLRLDIKRLIPCARNPDSAIAQRWFNAHIFDQRRMDVFDSSE